MKKLNIACISSGKHARKNIIPNLLQSRCFELVSIHARNTSGLEIFSKDVTDNEEEIYLDKNIEAVYISSPNALHADQIRKCLDNGKHVIVEKTSITDFNESMDLFELARSNNLIIFEAFMYKHHKQYKFIKNVINDKRFGKILFAESAFGFPDLDPSDIRYKKSLDGGALFDAGAYPISCVTSLINDLELSSSKLFISNSQKVDTKGYATFVNENMSAFCYWYIGASYQNFLKITFEDGILLANRVFSKPIDCNTSATLWKNGNISEEFNFDGDNHFENMFTDFYTKIIENDLSSNFEAFDQHKIIKKIYKSELGFSQT